MGGVLAFNKHPDSNPTPLTLLHPRLPVCCDRCSCCTHARMQCRVRPGSYTMHNPGPAPWNPLELVHQEWVVASDRDVRPYGICVYDA